MYELHEGDDLLVAFDGAANHRALNHRVMRIDDGLDLRGIDIEARTDDHFLGAPNDVKAIALEACEIAGIEPALAIDDLRRQIRCAIIAAHDVAPANVKLADFTSSHWYAVDCPDSGLDTRQQRSNRLIAAWRIEPNAGNSRRALGNAVAVGKRQAELLLDARLQIEVKRSAGHRNQAQRSAGELLETCHGLVFQQALIGRGHAVENGDPLFGD